MTHRTLRHRPGFTRLLSASPSGAAPQLRRGFTLIELIIFVGITTMTLVVLMTALTSMLSVREKTKVNADVQQSLRAAMERIGMSILNATSLVAADSDILSLGGAPGIGGESATAAIQYYRCGNAICAQESGGSAAALTPSSVNVSTLTFSNLSNGSPGTVKVTIAGTDTATSGVHPTFTLISSFSLRQ
jgi:type II secretory pathway pseudopilin PulG